MKQEYREAFTEVYEIIKLMPTELSDKIPNEFIKMLEEEKDSTYYPNFKEPIENEKLKDETVVILGLIYREFLCSEEEKEDFKKREANELRKFEQELNEKMREKYNPDDLFKRNKSKIKKDIDINDKDNVTIYKKEKWYEKIINIIKKFFGKNSKK